MFRELNNKILIEASKLHYTVKDIAPNMFSELIAQPTLVIWSGASDNTIWQDKRVNWAFRALHDALHLRTGIGFSVDEEIELGRIQANQYDGLLADIVYLEVAGQAEYQRNTGQFVQDQLNWMNKQLRGVK